MLESQTIYNGFVLLYWPMMLADNAVYKINTQFLF